MAINKQSNRQETDQNKPPVFNSKPNLSPETHRPYTPSRNATTKSTSEKKIDSFDDLKKIVTHLEKLTFKGVTGYLDRNPAFIALKRMSLNID